MNKIIVTFFSIVLFNGCNYDQKSDEQINLFNKYYKNNITLSDSVIRYRISSDTLFLFFKKPIEINKWKFSLNNYKLKDYTIDSSGSTSIISAECNSLSDTSIFMLFAEPNNGFIYLRSGEKLRFAYYSNGAGELKLRTRVLSHRFDLNAIKDPEYYKFSTLFEDSMDNVLK